MAAHRDLIVWKKGIELVKEVYLATQSYPQEELFGLTAQIRRCVVSIPSNIAEGCGRCSDKEFVRFLHIALGSAAELETQLIISRELSFLSSGKFENISTQNSEIIKMLTSLLKRLQSGNS